MTLSTVLSLLTVFLALWLAWTLTLVATDRVRIHFLEQQLTDSDTQLSFYTRLIQCERVVDTCR